MKRNVTIELEENDWGQIMDGLTCRAEEYELTARYYETGFSDGEILEVSDGHEARSILNCTGASFQKLKNNCVMDRRKEAQN